MKHLYQLTLLLLIAIIVPIAGAAQNDSTYHPGSIVSGSIVLCKNAPTFTIENLALPDTLSGTIVVFQYRWRCNGLIIQNTNSVSYTLAPSTLQINQPCTFTRESRACSTCAWHADSGQYTITVVPLPTVSITATATTLCAGETAVLMAGGTSGNDYVWSNNATTSWISVETSGTYSVTATDPHGCENAASQIVTVNPVYNTSLEAAICLGESYTLNGFNIAPVISGTTTHVLNLQTVHGCDSVVTLTLTVNPLPAPFIVGETSICEGQSATLTVYGGDTYSWSIGGTGNSISVTQPATYTVTATSTESCSATVSATVTVHPLPEVSISGESAFCAGSSTLLTASGAENYVWNTAETTDEITVIVAGTYTVRGVNTYGCENTASVIVTENPVYNTSLEAAICANELPYHYINGQIDTTFMEGTPSFSISGFQFSTFHGCDSTVVLTLTVYPSPMPFITGNMQFCSGNGTTLTAAGGAEYEWSTGETTEQIYVYVGDVYSVTVTDDNGCISSTEVTVTEVPSELEQKNIVSKNHTDGTPYMLVYPQANLLYQWFKNEEQLAGETRQYYVPTEGLEPMSVYTVFVQSQAGGGCGIYSSDWQWDGNPIGKVCVVPNPNDGRFMLTLPMSATCVSVYAANGEEVLQQSVLETDRVQVATRLPSGLYFVKVTQEDGTIITEKIIINQ